MKIDIHESTSTGPSTIILSHRGETMEWDTNAYSKSSDRKSPLNQEQIFKEINAFWQSLPEKDQDQFWELYSEAKQLFDTEYDHRVLQDQLQDITKRLYDLPSWEALHHWVVYRSSIRIPSDLKETFNEVDQVDLGFPHRKEKTYLRGEYVDLVVMTVALRAMVPIWSEFIRATKRDVGANSKELEAFRLLYRSKIHDSEAMRRLLEYIHITVEAELGGDLPITIILSGMGTTEINDWMTALTVVRRLSVCPISAEDDSANIITNVYQYVTVGVRGNHKKHGKKFGGRVTIKKSRELSDDRDYKSVAEIYKVKQEVPDGLKVFLNVYTENISSMLSRILQSPQDAALNERIIERYNLCFHQLTQIPQFEFEQHHLTLIQWVCAACLPPEGIHLLNYLSLTRTAAVTQTVLWEWGFYDLAVLTTASRFLPDEMDLLIGTGEARSRIPKETMETLGRLWPHAQPSKGRQSLRQNNVAARAVDRLSDLMTDYDWVVNAPKALADFATRAHPGRRYVPPSDVRTELANLLIHLYSQTHQPTEVL